MADTEKPMPGDLWRFGNPSTSATAQPFENLAGVATDPDAAIVTVQKPDLTKIVAAWPTPGAGQVALTKEAGQTGRFYVEVLFDMGGTWKWELDGTGAVTAASQGKVKVAKRLIS